MKTKHRTVIWRLLDGKPGHQNQSLGLVNALSSKFDCECIDITTGNKISGVAAYLNATWSYGKHLPLPDLIIGAGSRTHTHLLAAQKAYGGKTIVLMKPSLPASLYDLCLIPEHDEFRGWGTILETQGVLNTVSPSLMPSPEKCLIMIGGPSRHFKWQDEDVLNQLVQLIQHHPNKKFTLTTSRRTPVSLLEKLKKTTELSSITVFPYSQTNSEWLSTELANSASAWVTEDSVSMVYEALTANISVGLINLEITKNNRVAKGINKLVSDEVLTRFDSQGMYRTKTLPNTTFSEAERCATWIDREWLNPAINFGFEPAFG